MTTAKYKIYFMDYEHEALGNKLKVLSQIETDFITLLEKNE